ncbi:MAG: hypothetical protein Q8O67_16750 [Deltaproteobacteria bacterium]|nr:hypothetical protein [Deltaproteobacteria bacterium]
MTTAPPAPVPPSTPPTAAKTSRTAVLLGAQRFNPTLGSVVASLGIEGRVALITAGWQEREREDDELSTHLGSNTVNLGLHARGGAVFHEDKELAAGHREKQDLLRHLQEIYRIRLEAAFEAEQAVRAYDTPAAIRDEVAAASIEAIRGLDTWHIDQCARVRGEFETKFHLTERKAIIKQRAELKKLLKDCVAVAIAGGHVAVLINRLGLFDVDDLIEDRPVFAWSAGAMAVSDRIVLFHDDPPQGNVARQVLDVGLGFVPSTVVLPEPERRVNLDAHDRIMLVARRFAPATCLAFPACSYVVWKDGRLQGAEGVIELTADGEHRPFQPPAAGSVVPERRAAKVRDRRAR